MGSGAGFPGMVLAILGVKNVHLIESDVRKATFLREVSRETQTPVTVHDKRVEDCPIPNLDVITARALAPLTDLLVHMDKLTTKDHKVYGLFAKGLQHAEEVEKAQKRWNFEIELFPSETDLSGKILRITNLSRKN
jgi:16S rRNA (guanine527-N7)-methyltransferase